MCQAVRCFYDFSFYSVVIYEARVKVLALLVGRYAVDFLLECR